MKKRITVILLLVFAGIFAVSLWKILKINGEYQAGNDSYVQLEQYISLPEPEKTRQSGQQKGQENESDVQDVEIETRNRPVVDFEALVEINPDVVAWIYIEGTSVSYPVVQGADNDYYLYHTFDGTRNGAGCIFLDVNAPRDFSAQNSVLHGHHMKNGSMFAGITAYEDQVFYDAHPTALLLTPEKTYEISLFSGYVVDTQDNAWDPWFTDEAYQQWLDKITARSCFTSSVTPTTEQRVLTLSTCSYEFNDARFVLHGVIRD